jgi:hypothetical protein
MTCILHGRILRYLFGVVVCPGRCAVALDQPTAMRSNTGAVEAHGHGQDSVLYTIHYTPYTIHHTLYTIHYTPYCTPYTIHHTLYTHTPIHSYTHTLIHSYAHTLIHSYAHTLIHSYTHTLIRPYTHTLIRPYTHTLIHSYAHTLIHSYTHTPIHSYTHTLIHSYTHTLIRRTPSGSSFGTVLRPPFSMCSTCRRTLMTAKNSPSIILSTGCRYGVGVVLYYKALKV